jgi:hypothetical protein
MGITHGNIKSIMMQDSGRDHEIQGNVRIVAIPLCLCVITPRASRSWAILRPPVLVQHRLKRPRALLRKRRERQAGLLGRIPAGAVVEGRQFLRGGSCT